MRERPYHEKPKPKFSGDGYYLGLELELEAPTRELKTSGLNVVNDKQNYIYAKRDGSLGPWGWEAITHPISHDLWMTTQNVRHKFIAATGRVSYRTPNPSLRFLEVVGKLREMGYTSHETTRCGLHIHVSRSAFGEIATFEDLNNDKFYWFSRLINGPLFFKLSQRTRRGMEEWAMQMPVDRIAPATRSGGGRHVAVNITSNTVEVRIFRGNMRENRIRKAVEAVVAAVDFSGTLVNGPMMNDADLGTKFVAYVGANPSKYANLHAYMVECGMIRSSDICEDQLADEAVEVSTCA